MRFAPAHTKLEQTFYEPFLDLFERNYTGRKQLNVLELERECIVAAGIKFPGDIQTPPPHGVR